MSRSGYSDDCDGWALIRWRGAVASAIRGKRGQAFLAETLAALDEMPQKWLAKNTLHEPAEGEYCTLGALGAARGMVLSDLEDADRYEVADAFGIPMALAAEIMNENDEGDAWYEWRNPPANLGAVRWSRMRAWIAARIQGADQP